MPIAIFLVAFFAAFFVVSLIRKVLYAASWCVGWMWGLTSTITKDNPLKALALLAAASGVCLLLAHL